MKLKRRFGETTEHYNLRVAGLTEGQIRYALRKDVETTKYVKSRGVTGYRLRRTRELERLPEVMRALRIQAFNAKEAKLGMLRTYDRKDSMKSLQRAKRKELQQIIDWDAPSLIYYANQYNYATPGRPNPFWYK